LAVGCWLLFVSCLLAAVGFDLAVTLFVGCCLLLFFVADLFVVV
jgi:hypothetical protein